MKKTEIMYIPLLDTLQSQLDNINILDEVHFLIIVLVNLVKIAMVNFFIQINHGHSEITPGLLGDYCDSHQFQKHTLYHHYPFSLQLILYYDELELCNPLGSRRKKHKIGK